MKSKHFLFFKEIYRVCDQKPAFWNSFTKQTQQFLHSLLLARHQSQHSLLPAIHQPHPAHSVCPNNQFLEFNANREADRTKALLSLHWSSWSLPLKQSFNRISYKSILVDIINLSRTVYVVPTLLYFYRKIASIGVSLRFCTKMTLICTTKQCQGKSND